MPQVNSALCETPSVWLLNLYSSSFIWRFIAFLLVGSGNNCFLLSFHMWTSCSLLFFKNVQHLICLFDSCLTVDIFLRLTPKISFLTGNTPFPLYAKLGSILSCTSLYIKILWIIFAILSSSNSCQVLPQFFAIVPCFYKFNDLVSSENFATVYIFFWSFMDL